MILLHKAKRKDTGDEVVGFLTKVWGEYLIIAEHDEDEVYHVTKESIEPVIDVACVYTSLRNFGDDIASVFYKNSEKIAEFTEMEVKDIITSCTVENFIEWLRLHEQWERVGFSGYQLK